MSIVSLTSGDSTCTLQELRAFAEANNFTIPPGSLNETAFLLFANSFDAVCKTIQDLPEYQDPRLAPTVVQDDTRTYYRPTSHENPFNGWAHKTSLKLADPDAATGPLAGRTVVFKDNVSIAGLPLGLGCSPKHFKEGKHPISTIDATVVKRLLDAGATVRGSATCENFSASSPRLRSSAHRPIFLRYTGKSQSCRGNCAPQRRAHGTEIRPFAC